jgi:hypothetical protein
MRTLLLASVAAFALPVSAQAADITFEDFESAPYQFTLVGNANVQNGYNYQACCGTTGSVAALSNNFVAFGGGNLPSGVIFTSIPTVAGRSYTIAFDYGALGATGALDPLVLSINGQQVASVMFERPANNNLDQTFARTSYSFVANGSATTFSFNSLGNANVDAVLDNVSFASGVPEPATWGLMILGFGAVGAAMRRRRTSLAVA